MSEDIHDDARDFLSVAPGLKFTDAQKRAVFEFADYVLGQKYNFASPAPSPQDEPDTFRADAETLALLVRAYVTPDGMRPTTPPQSIAEMLRLVELVAPKEPPA